MKARRDVLKSVQRAVPASVREIARKQALLGLMPGRKAGRFPRRLIHLDELLASHHTLGVRTEVELVQETLPDGTIEWSPLRWPRRPVRSMFVMVDAPGGTGWRFDLNHLLSPNNDIVYEPNHPEINTPAMLRPISSNVRQVDGTVAYLSNTWPTNYSHWMLLTLPLVKRYRQHLGGEPDYWYVGEKPSRWQVESLEAAGVARDRLIHEPVAGTRMLNCAVGRYGRGVDAESMSFARSLFNVDSGDVDSGDEGSRKMASRLVFLARGEATTRRFLNEQECFEAVQPLGFEFVSTAGMSLAEEVTEFADTAVLLTCHGSASTNVAFAPRGCVLFELFPPELQNDSNPMFGELAAVSGGRYLALEGRPVSAGKKEIDADLDMDPSLLRSTAERLVSELNLQ